MEGHGAGSTQICLGASMSPTCGRRDGMASADDCEGCARHSRVGAGEHMKERAAQQAEPAAGLMASWKPLPC